VEDGFSGSPWKVPEWDNAKDELFKNIWHKSTAGAEPREGENLTTAHRGASGSSWAQGGMQVR